MKVELKPGETLEIVFEDNDGQIDVSFSECSSEIKVSSKWADDQGRIGDVYVAGGQYPATLEVVDFDEEDPPIIDGMDCSEHLG